MRKLIKGALIAAIYIVLCVMPGISAISFGPLQFRVAESLVVLPILYPEAIPGLFIGAFVANLTGPIGLIDAIFGSIATLLAAGLTYRLRKSIWAYWSPVIVNGIIVGYYLHKFYELPYLATAASIAVGEAVVVFTLGRLLVRKLRETKID
ncbi:QueT transporter family protein [Clostridia bacterium]|nr:QueT transporter family protein [Clostridia bacterium]